MTGPADHPEPNTPTNHPGSDTPPGTPEAPAPGTPNPGEKPPPTDPAHSSDPGAPTNHSDSDAPPHTPEAPAPGASNPSETPPPPDPTHPSDPNTPTNHPASDTPPRTPEAPAPNPGEAPSPSGSPVATAPPDPLHQSTSTTPATTTSTTPAPAPTSISATPRRIWTRTRGILLALVVLLAAAIAIAAVRSGTQHGKLDPRSADPYGSRAVAELLADRGVSTRVVTTSEEARSAAGPDTTLLVTSPDLLTDRQQSRLHTATKDSGGRTVLLTPGTPSIDTLAPGVTADATPSLDSTLFPRCSLPAAQRAGSADMGGLRYDTLAPDADACYLSDGLPSLLQL